MPVIPLPLNSSTTSLSLGIHPKNTIPNVPPSVIWKYPIGNLPDQDPIISTNIPFVPADGLGWDYFEATEVLTYWRSLWYQDVPGFNGAINQQRYMVTFTAPVIDSSGIGDNAIPAMPAGASSQFGIPEQGTIIISAEYFRRIAIPTATLNLNKPNYRSLVSGYSLDNRSIPNFPRIVSPTTKTIEISYYRWNRLENIPNLKSICWMVYKCQLVKDVPYILPVEDCMLGSLICSDAAALALITGLPNIAGKYRWADLTFTAIPSLFAGWYALYDATNTNPDNLPIFPEIRLLRKIAANNNIWNNATLGVDINPDPAHPMFRVDEELAYFNHLMPTVDGIGNLTMEGPHTKEIHAALNAGFYARDPATNLPRITNLGWRIERSNEVLGIRVKADGTIDEALEKTTNRRMHADAGDSNNVQEFNPNCFGKKGMLLRRLPNKFSRDGTVPGGYAKVRDLPQMMAELHEQANAAMGYQEGTAIEIKLDGQTYRYPNQLALLTELFVTAKQTATYSKGTFFSSIVAEQSIKEVMAGLGLRTVDKFLEFKVGKKAARLYYKGVSASQSVGRQLSAISTNIGMIIGNII